VGLGTLKVDATESAAQRILGAQEWASIVKTLESSPGVDIMAAPRVTAADGQQARIAVGSATNLPGMDKPVVLGPTIDLLPRLAEDRKSIDLTVNAQLNLRNEP
jgi:hypothetical protein